MKKKNFLYATGLMMVAALASCTDDLDKVFSGDEITVSVEMEKSSRTELAEDSRTITWSTGDKIYMFDSDGSSYGTLGLKDGVNEEDATFSGTVIGRLSDIDKALYPVPTKNGKEYTFDFPAERTWSANSAAPMIGDFDYASKHVQFRNLAALIRIDLTGYNYGNDSELVLTMTGGPFISGAAMVDVSDETLAIADGGNTVTVKSFGSARFVDIPVPAGTYTSYNVTIDGVLLAEGEAGTLGRNSVAILGQKEVSLQPNGEGIYEIRTAAEMFWLAEQVNAGNAFNGQTFKLMNNIDMSLKDWTPIGIVPPGESTNNFGGTFDGGGFTLSGLKAEGGDAALFGRTSGATIKNLTIDNSEFTGSNWAGCLVAYVSSTLTLENVSATNSMVTEKGEQFENRLLGSGRKNPDVVITIDNAKFASSADQLQAIVDGEGNEINVALGCDIEGDVIVTQKPNVKVTIDGNKYKYKGTITVDGKSARYETAALTIRNVNFDAESLNAEAYINLGVFGNRDTRYTNHVTVEDCTFSGNGDKFVAVKSYTGGDKNLTIDGCVVNKGMHSLVQVTNVEENLKISGCEVYSKNGANLNNTPTLEMDDCTFDVRGYAVRFGVNETVSGDSKIFEIKNSELKSACEDGDAVIIFRDTAKKATLKLTNTTLIGDTEISGQIAETTIIIDGVTQKSASSQSDFSSAITAGGDVAVTLGDGNYELPEVRNGNIEITGTKDAVITIKTPAFHGSDVTLNGVTIKATGEHTGIQHVNTVTYNGAIIDGEMNLYGKKVVFNECEFNLEDDEYIWTYDAKEAEFNGCIFNTKGKAILVYKDGGLIDTKVTVKGCTFNATAGAKASAIANQNCAAIELHNYQSNITLITAENKIGENFSGEWRIKNYDKTNNCTINVNNIEYTQIAIDGKLMTIDGEKNVTVIE